MEKHWQLPTRQSNLTNHDWIHPRAKFHCFEGEERDNYYVGGESLCKNHYQVTRDFEDYKLSYILENFGAEALCPKCYKLYLERQGNENEKE